MEAKEAIARFCSGQFTWPQTVERMHKAAVHGQPVEQQKRCQGSVAAKSAIVKLSKAGAIPYEVGIGKHVDHSLVRA